MLTFLACQRDAVFCKTSHFINLTNNRNQYFTNVLKYRHPKNSQKLKTSPMILNKIKTHYSKYIKSKILRHKKQDTSSSSLLSANESTT